MSAVLLGPNDPPQKVQVGNYTLEVTYLETPMLCPEQRRRANPPSVAIVHCDGA
jgi:hypothetical protein